jgi:hypothetical protein
MPAYFIVACTFQKQNYATPVKREKYLSTSPLAERPSSTIIQGRPNFVYLYFGFKFFILVMIYM